MPPAPKRFQTKTVTVDAGNPPIRRTQGVVEDDDDGLAVDVDDDEQEPNYITGLSDKELEKMMHDPKKAKAKAPKDPKKWSNGLFDCCAVKPSQGCPCCATNIFCAPCAFGNAMELAELGDIWPSCSSKVCRGRFCPSHLVGDQCLLTCALACDCHLNGLYSLWAAKKVADKYGIVFETHKEVPEALLCPPCYRWKVVHEIMEREKLVYLSECGLCEIVREPEEEEEEGKEEEDEEKAAEAKKLGIAIVSASGAPTVAEMHR